MRTFTFEITDSDFPALTCLYHEYSDYANDVELVQLRTAFRCLNMTENTWSKLNEWNNLVTPVIGSKFRTRK